jgi:hypothetical protein
MLQDQPDLRREDAARDMDLWRRMYTPNDRVRVGSVTAKAAEVPVAEYCWGCAWCRDGVPGSAVAICLRATELGRGYSCAEPMTRREALEAVLGRMRAARLPLLLVVDDGEGGMEAWIDVSVQLFRNIISRGRCPGGRNAYTGRPHRVLWSYEGLFEPWSVDGWDASETRASRLGLHLARVTRFVQPQNIRQDPRIGSRGAVGRS